MDAVKDIETLYCTQQTEGLTRGMTLRAIRAPEPPRGFVVVYRCTITCSATLRAMRYRTISHAWAFHPYNVPVCGAAFVLEVLLGTIAPHALVAALATSVIASTTAWIGLGNVPQYQVPPLDISASLAAGSIVTGRVCGAAAYAFRALTDWASARTPGRLDENPVVAGSLRRRGFARDPVPAASKQWQRPVAAWIRWRSRSRIGHEPAGPEALRNSSVPACRRFGRRANAERDDRGSAGHRVQ